MDRIEVLDRGRATGAIELFPEGSRVLVRAAVSDPGDGLYRLSLLGEKGSLPLGVLAPEGGELTLARRLYARDVAALGTLRRGEVVRSFRFGDETHFWQETRDPAALFRGDFLRARLRPFSSAWRRKEGDTLLLALPLEDGRPFPLEALFCLARVERVEGRPSAVFAFRGEEPVLP